MDENAKNQSAPAEPPPKRFVVGNSKATYINGRSVKSVPSFDLDGAIKAQQYMSGLDFGRFVIFELVPIGVDTQGEIKRLTK